MTPLARVPLGNSLAVFVRREEGERFVEEVRGDDPELASYLRIEERGLEAGGPNQELRVGEGVCPTLQTEAISARTFFPSPSR